jgi:hypothetical protein
VPDGLTIAERHAAVRANAHFRVRGRTRTYRRSDGTEATLLMVRGSTDAEARTPSDAIINTRLDDWLVKIEDFRKAFGDVAVPKQDDAVIDGGRRYRVKPHNGEPCYRPSDGAGVLWRIHSKDDGPDA